MSLAPDTFAHTTPASRVGLMLCVGARRRNTMSPDNVTLTPSERCLFCQRRIGEVGGRRIVSQQVRGVTISTQYQGGGSKDYPRRSIELGDESGRYVVVWGEDSEWTQQTIEKARNEFLSGHRPWFCQVCGGRTCSKCGSPLDYPMASDLVDDNGHITHAAILPFEPGCINPECDKHRKPKNDRPG